MPIILNVIQIQATISLKPLIPDLFSRKIAMWKIILCASAIVCLIAYSLTSLYTRPNTTGSNKQQFKNIEIKHPEETYKTITEKSKNSTENTQTHSRQNARNGDLPILDSISGMAAPKKIVSKLISDYRSNASPSAEEKMELLSALSFCANRRSITTVIGEERGKGTSNPTEMQGLNATYAEYIKYCTDLSDDSYLTRRSILDSLAAQGHPEARSSYFEVGPLGRWPQENEHIPLSKEQIDDWIETSVNHLLKNSNEGDFQAYKTLATIYESRPDDPILGKSADKVKAYTYDYLWGTSIVANPKTSTEVKNSIATYLNEKGKELNSAQIDQAHKNAVKIHSDSKPGNR